MTSQHILYYCTYYSVSFTCTVHCTYYTYCTLYTQYMFPVSLFPMLSFHLQHLFTTLVHLYKYSLIYKFTQSHSHSVALHLSKHHCQCLLTPHHLGKPQSYPSFEDRPTTSSPQHLCTVSIHYSDAPHLRTPACQYKDIPDAERNRWTA